MTFSPLIENFLQSLNLNIKSNGCFVDEIMCAFHFQISSDKKIIVKYDRKELTKTINYFCDKNEEIMFLLQSAELKVNSQIIILSLALNVYIFNVGAGKIFVYRCFLLIKVLFTFICRNIDCLLKS